MLLLLGQSRRLRPGSRSSSCSCDQRVLGATHLLSTALVNAPSQELADLGRHLIAKEPAITQLLNPALRVNFKTQNYPENYRSPSGVFCSLCLKGVEIRPHSQERGRQGQREGRTNFLVLLPFFLLRKWSCRPQWLRCPK